MNPQPPQISASQFPDVYADLGIDTGKLGCLMLNVEPIKVSDVILYGDLYETDPVEHPHMQGIVSETDGVHVTLLYGFLRSATELKKHIDAVLDGSESGLKPWTPEDPTIANIDVFPSNDPGMKYVTLIAKLVVTPNLLEANTRLKLLPHLDTFSSFTPHCTLAYLNDTADTQAYIQRLNETYQGKTIKALDLNYGD